MAYGIVGFQDSEISQAIDAKYGKQPTEKTYAEKLAVIAGEFTQNNPVGSLEGKKKRNERRAYRRKCREYIAKRAKEEIHPVGFGGFIFMAILSGIISWLVQILLKKHFGEPDASTARMEALEDIKTLSDLGETP